MGSILKDSNRTNKIEQPLRFSGEQAYIPRFDKKLEKCAVSPLEVRSPHYID